MEDVPHTRSVARPNLAIAVASSLIQCIYTARYSIDSDGGTMRDDMAVYYEAEAYGV